MNQYGEPYTQEQKEWVRKYYLSHSLKETTKAFNQRYNLNKTEIAIKHQVKGITKDLKTNYTEEMINFLKEQIAIPNNTWKPITELFNKIFNTNIRWEALKRKASSLGLKTEINRDSNFTFHPKPRYEIGTERIHQKWNGETYIVVKVDNKHKGKNWKLKHQLVWEQANGKMPKNHRIVFLDGNTLNCELSNLKCIDQATFKKLQGNRYKNYYGLGKVSEAFIEICETEKIIERSLNNE